MRISDWSSDVCSSDLVGDSDYSAVITKLKALNPDLIYFGGYHAELGLLLRQAREQGLKTQFMGPEGVANKDLVAIAGPAVEGLLVTLPADFTKLPGNEKVLENFTKAKRSPDGAFTLDRKSTRLNSSHYCAYRMPSSA